MTALGRFVVVTLMLGAAFGLLTAFNSAGLARVADAVVTPGPLDTIGITGWPAIVVAALYFGAYLLRSLTESTHWVHHDALTGLVAGVGGLLVGVGQAIERHGLSKEVVIAAVVTGAIGLMVVTKPQKKPPGGLS